MSERARVARFPACVLLAALVAGSPLAVTAEGNATPGDPAAATSADPPAAGATEDPSEDPAADAPPAAKVPDPPPGPPPLGPGIAGEGHVPLVQPAVDVAGGEEPAPKHLRTIPTDEAAGVLGKRVIGPAGEDIGMVVDVLIDNAGKPRAAVVDFGGFLGVGTRKIAVDWTFLQFRPGDSNVPVLLDVTGDAIRAAPEYRPSDAETSVVSPPAEDDGGDADTPAPAAGEPADDQPAADGTPAPKVPEEAKPPPPSAEGRDRRPLPEMKPPEGRPKAHPPAAGLPSADDLGPAPAPALPQIPPDARQ